MFATEPVNLDSCQRNRVTTTVAALAITCTTMWHLEMRMDWAFLDANLMKGEFWRVITSGFPHVNILHLAFNVYWLWVFGVAIESTWGSPKTATLYTYLLAGSALAQYALDEGGVGLSGLGYGLWAFLWAVGRREPAVRGVVTRETNYLFVIWFFLCVVLTRTGSMRVGNVAHFSGAVMGGVAGLAVVHRNPKRALLAALGAFLVIVSLLGATFFRPLVNANAGQGLARLAYEANEDGDVDRAIELYREAIAYKPTAMLWYNLGCAYYRKGDRQQTDAAMEEAYRLDPRYSRAAEHCASVRAVQAYEANERGESEKAERFYREALQYTPRSGALWNNLAILLQDTGRHAEARSAYAKACEVEPHNEIYRLNLEGIQDREALEEKPPTGTP